MANETQSVVVCAELQTALGVFSGIVSDVMAKKNAGQVLGDALPSLVSALSGLSALTLEVTPANGAAVDATVALWAVGLKQILVPGVV